MLSSILSDRSSGVVEFWTSTRLSHGTMGDDQEARKSAAEVATADLLIQHGEHARYHPSLDDSVSH